MCGFAGRQACGQKNVKPLEPACCNELNMDAVGVVKRETFPAHLTACVSLRDRPFLPSPADLTACQHLDTLFRVTEADVLVLTLNERQRV